MTDNENGDSNANDFEKQKLYAKDVPFNIIFGFFQVFLFCTVFL